MLSLTRRGSRTKFRLSPLRPLTLGSDPVACDVVLDEYQGIEPCHAILLHDTDQSAYLEVLSGHATVHYEDLPTVGIRVEAGHSLTLYPGDELKLGNWVAVLKDTAVPDAPLTTSPRQGGAA